MLGAKESSRLNLTITAVNVVVIAFIVAVGASRLSPANWHPFAPHGVSGILSGASYVFFSFIGFDAGETTARGTHQRTQPQCQLPSTPA